MWKKLRWIGMSLCLAAVTLSLFGAALAEDGDPFDHFVYLPLAFKPLPPTDLVLAQTSAPNPYEAGAPITYTLMLTNTGPATLTEVTLTTLVPQAVLTPVYTTTVGAYHPVSGTWISLTLGAGDAISLQISGTVSETFTGTLTSTAVVTPVGAWEQNAADNTAIDINPIPALLNPGFEGEHWHKTFEGENGAMAVPEFWVAWWTKDADEGLDTPESVRVIDDSIPGYVEPVSRIFNGHQAVKISRSERWEAGFYQRVDGLPVGSTAEFSVYAHAWSCNEQFPDPPATSCGDPWAMWFRVGIDPEGNQDPWAEDIVWTENTYIYDAFEPVGPITATVGQDGSVTVYLYAGAKWIQWYNEAYWDDAALIIRP